MIEVRLAPEFDEWRDKARRLLSQNVAPEDVYFKTTDDGFSFEEPLPDLPVDPNLRISREFMADARIVCAHRDDTTLSLLYRIAWRLVYENRDLLKDPLDEDLVDFHHRKKLVTRDMHKMKAFVRFKEVPVDGKSVYMAWHDPDHRIVRLVAPFFKDRFNGMNWVIMTRDETVSWDGKELSFAPGVEAHEVDLSDEKEDLWKTYYKSIFNPGRIKISAMKKELPVRHWKTLPESELITSLIQEAPQRLQTFYDSQKPAAPVAKSYASIDELNASLEKCRACGICPQSRGPVKGAGPSRAKVMVIGEQPGNEEDLQGLPFIGPAGKLLTRAFEASGHNRDDYYLTNAVKGFKFIPKENFRLHRSASSAEISTCRPWLREEIALVKPELIVCLGRSAAQSLTGKLVKIEDVRGRFFETPFAKKTVILPHPSALLRAEDARKDELYEKFVAELRGVRAEVERLS